MQHNATECNEKNASGVEVNIDNNLPVQPLNPEEHAAIMPENRCKTVQKRLKTRQKLVITMLARGETVQKVANMMRIRRETIFRWKQQPHFQVALEKAMQQVRDDLAESMQNRLCYTVTLALDAVVKKLQPALDCDVRNRMALEVLKLAGNEKFQPTHATFTD